MPNLLHLQTAFQDFLCGKESTISQQIISTAKVNADTRLNIYREAYILRLQEALNEDYAAFSHCIGEEAFNRLTQKYIAQYPSNYRSLRWFGQHFSEFLKKEKNISQYQPGLIELAQFEWALVSAFDVKDQPLLTVEDMGKVPAQNWPTLTFTLHDSAHVFCFYWNTVELWQALMKNSANFSKPAFVKNSLPTDWLVWRMDYDVKFKRLSRDELNLIKLILQNKNFSEICEAFLVETPSESVALHVASLLKGLIQDGLIVDLG